MRLFQFISDAAVESIEYDLKPLRFFRLLENEAGYYEIEELNDRAACNDATGFNRICVL